MPLEEWMENNVVVACRYAARALFPQFIEASLWSRAFKKSSYIGKPLFPRLLWVSEVNDSAQLHILHINKV